MARVLLPLPSRDFDPTEAAVSWKVLGRLGHDIAFATPDGREAVADDVMVTGEGLDPWGLVPVLRRIKVIGEAPGYRNVQAEVTRALASPSEFLDVDPADVDPADVDPADVDPADADARRKTGGTSRDRFDDARPAFVVCDGNYVSARWPGDTHTFAKTFAGLLG